MNLISVTTCPRKDGTSYLERTLTRLNATGANEWCNRRIVFADGCYPEVPRNWQRIGYTGPSGSRIAMWRVLRHAQIIKARQLLYLEDDITCCENFCSWALDVHIPHDAGFVSFFRKITQPNPVIGAFEKLGAQHFRWTQALLIPARTIEYLTAIDPLTIASQNPNRRPYDNINANDEVLGLIMAQSPTPYYFLSHYSMVDHLGAVSSIHPTVADRKSSVYLGDNYRL